ncbi:MAG: hypothetical protein JO316_05470 [Abitibacteriaceae bacterium]|nr:hypothetical protein [Abditibacteriaceae bacterium]MBV9864776.1 hypothetical protein [Abditibacteriaceae bacterium]
MDELQAGDKVVELGAMVRSVTVATGSISSTLLLFLARQSLGSCLTAFLIGAITGFIIGLLLSRLLYADGKGNVKIVKATPANFPITVSAALKGGTCQTVVVLIGLGLSGKIVAWPLTVEVVSGVNLLIALAIARLSLL